MDPSQSSICSPTIHVICKTCLPHFSLVDVVRLCTSSKALSEVCTSYLAAGNRLLAHDLLRKTVQGAAQLAVASATPTRRSRKTARRKQHRSDSNSSQVPLQTVKALEWLLQVAGSEHLLSNHPTNPQAVETVSVLLHTTPAVHLDICKVLVAGGLRITYAQLFQAAKRNPQGLAVWIKAHQRLRLHTGFPAHITNICCGWGLSMERLPCALPPNHLADTIYLAMSTAGSAAQFERTNHLIMLPEATDLRADVLSRLLHVAAVRHCTFAVNRSRQTPTAHQADVDLDTGYNTVIPGSVVSSLCRLPAAKCLTQPQVICLMRVAAEACSADLMKLLCTQLMAAATCLTADAVMALLLHVATQHTFNTDKVAAVCAPLCALPAMQQLKSPAIVRLLHQAIQLRGTGVVVVLCGLPGAEKIQQQSAKDLIKVARESWGASSVVGCSGMGCVTELQPLARVCGCL